MTADILPIAAVSIAFGFTAGLSMGILFARLTWQKIYLEAEVTRAASSHGATGAGGQ